MKSVWSVLVNTWRGIGFWSGFMMRNRLIFTLKPAKESLVTDIILGLCVVVSALVPITAVYELFRTARDFRTQEAAISFSTALVFVAVVGMAFYRRVFVWPAHPRPASDTAQEFERAAFSMLSTKGSGRWKLIGLSVAQAAITVGSIIYVKQHNIGGALVIYVAVWLPAVVVLVLAAATAIGFHASSDWSASDKALMGAHVSANLTVVAFIVAGLVAWAASVLIGLAVFILGGFILWRVFAGRTDPANTTGLFESARSPATQQWRDTSGATHVDSDGQIHEAHTGRLLGDVDASGRVTDTDGVYRGSVGGDGRVR